MKEKIEDRRKEEVCKRIQEQQMCEYCLLVGRPYCKKAVFEKTPDRRKTDK
jgi:hypothetical protein